MAWSDAPPDADLKAPDWTSAPPDPDLASGYWGDVQKHAEEGLKQWPQAAETMGGQALKIGRAMMPGQVLESGAEALSGKPVGETPIGEGAKALYDIGKGAVGGVWQGIKDTGSAVKAPFEMMGGTPMAQTEIGEKFRERPLSVPAGVVGTVTGLRGGLKALGGAEAGAGVAEEVAAGLPKETPIVGKGPIPTMEPADIYYHGTNNADAIRKSGFNLENPGGSPYLGDNIVEGVHLSSSKEPYIEGGQLEGIQDVLPVKSEAQNILKTDIAGIENLYRKFGINKLAEDASMRLTEALKSQGYDGLQFMDETVIFDPSKVKLHEGTPSEPPPPLRQGTPPPESPPSTPKPDPMQEVQDYIAQTYGEQAAKPGMIEGAGRYLQNFSQEMGGKDIGIQPRQIQSMGPGLQGLEKAEALIDYARDKGYFSPTLTDVARKAKIQ